MGLNRFLYPTELPICDTKAVVRFGVVRLDANGALDTSFGDDDPGPNDKTGTRRTSAAESRFRSLAGMRRRTNLRTSCA